MRPAVAESGVRVANASPLLLLSAAFGAELGLGEQRCATVGAETRTLCRLRLLWRCVGLVAAAGVAHHCYLLGNGEGFVVEFCLVNHTPNLRDEHGPPNKH